MPIIRKVIRVGSSKAVSLPKSWLKFYERESGAEIHEVAIEVNRVLTITPILAEKKSPKNE